MLRRTSSTILRFTTFALVYYAPYLIESGQLRLDEDVLRAAFLDALAVRAVRFDLLHNLLGHLLLLVFFYALVHGLAVRLAAATGIGTCIASLSMFTVVWVLLVAGNSALFPLSDYSTMFNALDRPTIGVAALAVLAVASIFVTMKAVRLRVPLVGAGMAGIVLGALLIGSAGEHGRAVAASDGRNVIIIGVDSLAPHILDIDAASAVLPNIEALSKSGISFERAYTPLGRTFPAWVSLLSGAAPAEHGAIFNLRGLDKVRRESLVTHALQGAGYRTVFAIDERRFSNLDESFGFDQVIGPKAGALDFVLQRFNDTPLTNLALQTRLGGQLFPFSRFNAAAHASYDADGFVEEILNAVAPADKVFLAAHFESAHFPFKSRHASESFDHPNRFVSRHVSALAAVDAQIGKLLTGLRANGRLDDALLVMLSDHGESLGEIEASTTRGGRPYDIHGYGHGADLLSEHQSRIVLTVVRFRDGRPAGPASARTDQVSITDLRAAIERFARDGRVSIEPADSCMFVETGIRFAASSTYAGLDERALASEGAGYYEVDSLGRLQLREDRLAALVDAKDVGWRCRDRLTFYSKLHDDYFAYELIREGRQGVEVAPRASDIARIRTYRAQLRQAADG